MMALILQEQLLKHQEVRNESINYIKFMYSSFTMWVYYFLSKFMIDLLFKVWLYWFIFIYIQFIGKYVC